MLQMMMDMAVRPTTDADMNAAAVRATTMNEEFAFPEGEEDTFFNLGDRCLTVTFGGRTVAIVDMMNQTTEEASSNLVWMRDGFTPETIRTVIDAWAEFTAMVGGQVH
jgi:hypothetical protein